jgi:hypothetical protein
MSRVSSDHGGLQTLPDFLANRVLEGLVRGLSISAAQLHLFAGCATSLTVPPSVPLGNGGAWLAAIQHFRFARTTPPP